MVERGIVRPKSCPEKTADAASAMVSVSSVVKWMAGERNDTSGPMESRVSAPYSFPVKTSQHFSANVVTTSGLPSPVLSMRMPAAEPWSPSPKGDPRYVKLPAPSFRYSSEALSALITTRSSSPSASISGVSSARVSENVLPMNPESCAEPAEALNLSPKNAKFPPPWFSYNSFGCPEALTAFGPKAGLPFPTIRSSSPSPSISIAARAFVERSSPPVMPPLKVSPM